MSESLFSWRYKKLAPHKLYGAKIIAHFFSLHKNVVLAQDTQHNRNIFRGALFANVIKRSLQLAFADGVRQ